MPSNKGVIDVKPSNFGVIDVKPKLKTLSIGNNEAVYTDTKTINKAQPIPWGLNWLITYPSELNFTVTRE